MANNENVCSCCKGRRPSTKDIIKSRKERREGFIELDKNEYMCFECLETYKMTRGFAYWSVVIVFLAVIANVSIADMRYFLLNDVLHLSAPSFLYYLCATLFAGGYILIFGFVVWLIECKLTRFSKVEYKEEEED